MIALCLADEEELKILEDKTKKRVDEECKKAAGDKEVDLQELNTDIYAKNVDGKIRGVSGYHLEHFRLSEVCFGKPRKTPLSEIKDVPVGAAIDLAKAKERKAAQEAKEGKAGQKPKDPKAAKDSKGGDGDKKAKPPAAGAPKPPTAAAKPPANAPPAKAPSAKAPPTKAPPAKTPPAPKK